MLSSSCQAPRINGSLQGSFMLDWVRALRKASSKTSYNHQVFCLEQVLGSCVAVVWPSEAGQSGENKNQLLFRFNFIWMAFPQRVFFPHQSSWTNNERDGTSCWTKQGISYPRIWQPFRIPRKRGFKLLLQDNIESTPSSKLWFHRLCLFFWILLPSLKVIKEIFQIENAQMMFLLSATQTISYCWCCK